MKKVIASLLSVAMVAAMAAGCAQTTEPATNGGDGAGTPDAVQLTLVMMLTLATLAKVKVKVRAMKQLQRQCLSVLVLK